MNLKCPGGCGITIDIDLTQKKPIFCCMCEIVWTVRSAAPADYPAQKPPVIQGEFCTIENIEVEKQ